MIASRRALLASLLVLPVLTVAAAAAGEPIYRVNGAVTDGNFRGLEAFLYNSVDAIVGLKVSFTAQNEYRDGVVQAYEDGGMFTTYRPGEDMETEISATKGYDFRHGAYVFDGFYLVKYGGLYQGIEALSLQPVDEGQVLLSGRTVKDLEIDSLDPSLRGK